MRRAAIFLSSVLFLSAAQQAHSQTITEEQVEAALPKLEAYVDALIANEVVPGLSVAVVHKGRLVYLWGFGEREAGTGLAVDGDTVFQIASLSKPVSSSVVAAIISSGAVRWDSRIAAIDPDFQLSEAYPSAQATLTDLFSHRSGLPGLAGNDLEEIGYRRAEILKRLALVPPASSFRSAYSYSNFGMTAGGVAAAKAIGLDWETAAERLLFQPLGMAVTSYRNSDFLAHENRAALHVGGVSAWQALVTRDPDPQAPAGGVSSSARDMAAWMLLQLGGGEIDGTRVIDAAPLADTHRPIIDRGIHPVTGAQSFYGLGWNITYGRHGLVYGHSGAFSRGARSVANLMPHHDLGIVVLTNAFPTGAPEAVADTFFDLVFYGAEGHDWLKSWSALFAGMFGPAIEASRATYGTPPEPASPALDDSAYIGRYANAYVGEAVVAAGEGGLTLTLGPDGAKTYPLTHFDRDLFTIVLSPELPELKSAVRFSIGAGGQAESVTIEEMDGAGLGTLGRVDGE